MSKFTEETINLNEFLEKKLSKDMVNHPEHYISNGIEVIEVIEAFNLDYHRGNAVKYICRAGRKDVLKEIEDLKKAVFYLNRKIELLEKSK